MCRAAMVVLGCSPALLGALQLIPPCPSCGSASPAPPVPWGPCRRLSRSCHGPLLQPPWTAEVWEDDGGLPGSPDCDRAGAGSQALRPQEMGREQNLVPGTMRPTRPSAGDVTPAPRGAPAWPWKSVIVSPLDLPGKDKQRELLPPSADGCPRSVVSEPFHASGPALLCLPMHAAGLLRSTAESLRCRNDVCLAADVHM